jgi:hypothetical protein
MLLEGAIDWSRLVDVARGGGQTLRLEKALAYLADVAGTRPPPEALDELASAGVSRRERLVYVCTTRRFRRMGALPLLVAEHVSETADKSLVRAAASFPVHLRDRWGLPHVWQVPVAAGRRAVRLLTKHTGVTL